MRIFPQSIVKLNTNLQAVDVNVAAHKTIILCSVYLAPRILMGDVYGHHTLWGCEDVNNRGQQFEDLI